MPFSVKNLRCEYLRNPLGIDVPRPRLSWRLESAERNLYQESYRIRVSASADALERGEAELWNSGWTQGALSSQVEYNGSSLQSGAEAHWEVSVRDNQGRECHSPTAKWSVGLLEKEDWTASWIAGSPKLYERDKEVAASSQTDCPAPVYFRKEFSTPSSLKRATLYTSARGLYIFYLNGHRVGTDCFAPEWTDYNQRIQYRTHDVTPLIGLGTNALGAILGDGWYSGYVGWQETRGRYGLQNSLIAQLILEYDDGSTHRVVSDPSWHSNTGPVLYSDFMMGEHYDARREEAGWNRTGFIDSNWLPAVEVAPPGAALVASRSEPVCIVEERQPVHSHQPGPGVLIFDLGQNITGWTRIKVTEPAGTILSLRHGERLNPDGTLYTENLRRATATDVYVCSGKDDETWEPHFTFHGFQYVEITGATGTLDRKSITGCVIHSATPPSGAFSCSHEGVNRLWLNGYWSQKDNFLSVPTDCPQRDERLGWMGDAQVFARTAMYNMDVAAFFSKWMMDVRDAQTDEGIFPDTAPRLPEKEGNFVGLDGLAGAAAWADAGIIIPWNMWEVYGDLRMVSESWDSMVAWMDYLEKTNPDWLRINELGNNYGDWLCIPSDTSFRTHSPMKNLLATAFWANDASLLAKFARLLGQSEQEQRFLLVFENVRDAFQGEFLNSDGSLTVDTQTAYLLALAFDLIPERLRPATAAHLVENIRSLNWHLSTGFCGIRFLNPVLSDHGYADVAYRLLLQDDYPSWLYPIKHGATTIWERWNGWTEKDGFFNPKMNSFNHYSLGSVGEWLFSHVAGIRPGCGSGGFSCFEIKPYPSRKLEHATASYQSHQGLIESGWLWNGHLLELRFALPANTRARVYIPSDDGSRIVEDDKDLTSIPGVQYRGRDGYFSIYDFPSGSYCINSIFTPTNP